MNENNINFIEEIDTAVAELKCAHSQIAYYSGLSSSRFSRGTNGDTPFTSSEQKTIAAVLDAMRQLQTSVNPVPVDWSQVGRLKPLVDRQIKNLDQSQARPVPFDIITVGPALFQRVVAGRIETTTSYRDCAAFPVTFTPNKSISNIAAKLLDKMTPEFVRSTRITNEIRPVESFTTTLEEIGLQDGVT